MSDQFIVENASPTLAGLKTGNLFSVEYTDRKTIDEEIRDLNHVLTDKGLRAVPVRYMKNRVLIYLYRPDFLDRDIKDPDVADILREKGYSLFSANRCIVQLITNLKTCSRESFPHEIGLFLGYPAEDVRGFMQDTRKGAKIIGCWKVYGDQEKAEQTFDRYRNCTKHFRTQIQSGKTLEQLIVRTAAE